MGGKDGLTKLSDTDLVNDEGRRRLADIGVTTVEELVGLLASQPDDIRELLGLDGDQLDRLRRDAEAALPEETRRAIRELPLDDFPRYGALEPEREP